MIGLRCNSVGRVKEMKSIRLKLVNTGLLLIAGAMCSCGTLDMNRGLVPEQEVAVLKVHNTIGPFFTAVFVHKIDGQVVDLGLSNKINLPPGRHRIQFSVDLSVKGRDSGEVEFTARPGGRYALKSRRGLIYGHVWLEDVATGSKIVDIVFHLWDGQSFPYNPDHDNRASG
jgi:hypothetical protein